MSQRSSAVSLANFSAQARGGKSSIVEHTILPDTDSPGVALTELFAFQSYYDSTALQRALLVQSQNEPIVGSTLKKANVSGYAFGLHPSSQTPIAVQPIVGGQGASPQTGILKPGQIYRPHGRPSGRPGHFSGFNWGLPFGWLGGGVATLYVFPSPDADVAWPGDAEVIFHRQRMQILVPASQPTTAPLNWPLRFPWTQAERVGPISQKGAAIVSISNPTRLLMSLRLNALTNPSEMRMILQSSNDMDLNSAGVATGETRFDSYIWGTYAASGIVGSLGTSYPVIEYDGPLARMGADDGGMALVDMSGGSLSAAYVDLCRYGKL